MADCFAVFCPVSSSFASKATLSTATKPGRKRRNKRRACETACITQPQTSIHRRNWTLKTPPPPSSSSPGLDDGSETFVTLDKHEFIKETEAVEEKITRDSPRVRPYTVSSALSGCSHARNILKDIKDSFQSCHRRILHGSFKKKTFLPFYILRANSPT